MNLLSLVIMFKVLFVIVYLLLDRCVLLIEIEFSDKLLLFSINGLLCVLLWVMDNVLIILVFVGCSVICRLIVVIEKVGGW